MSVRSVECSGIRFRRVLFGMEGRLGQMKLCQMKGMIAGGDVLYGDRWVVAFAVDVLQCSVGLC